MAGGVVSEIAGVVHEQISPPLALIGQACHPRSEYAPQTKTELSRLWRLRLVVDQKRFGCTGAARQAADRRGIRRQVAVVPMHRSGCGGAIFEFCDVRGAGGVLDLIHPKVEQGSPLVEPVTPQYVAF